MARSFLAVIVGYLVMAAGVIVMTAGAAKLFPGALPTGGQSPGTGYLIFNLVYSFGFALLGGYVAAVIGRRGPVIHAVGLAALMVIMALVSLKLYAGQQPRWYQYTLCGMAIPAVLGGWLRTRQAKTKVVNRTPL